MGLGIFFLHNLNKKKNKNKKGPEQSLFS